MQRGESAGIDRHFGKDVLDREIDRRFRRRDHAVHRAPTGRARAREIEVKLGPFLAQGEGDAQRLVVDPVGIDDAFALVDAVGDGRDLGAHLLRCTRLQFDDGPLDDSLAVAVDQRGQTLLADRQRRRLRLDVADALIGDADVGEDDREDLLVEHAFLVELDRRQAEPLLLDLGSVGREAAGHRAAHVRPVSGIRKPREVSTAIEERLDELDVHQMGAAEIGVVDDEDIAWVHRPRPLDHRLRRELHGADENRQAEIALGDELAGIAVIDAVGAVERLGDHRAEGGAHEGEVHLVANLLQPVLDHGEGNGVEGGRHWSPRAVSVTMRLPKASTVTLSPGSITVVASSCSTIAGPMNSAPRGRLSRR